MPSFTHNLMYSQKNLVHAFKSNNIWHKILENQTVSEKAIPTL